MRIGVFDSGVGGRSVSNAIRRAFLDAEVIYVRDRENVPYGTKSIDELRTLTTPKIKELEADGCDIIVIACNTVSTTIIDDLRAAVSVPIIGVEPMIEAAANATKTGVITICATPRTLGSDRYRELITRYAGGLTVLEPDCSDWALMIERDEVEQTQIRNVIGDCLAKQSDVIVLGCTHYHWIEKIIERETEGRAIILQPEQDAIAEIKQVLKQLG